MSTTISALAPIEIWEVMIDNATIKFFDPLIIQPRILDKGTPSECLYAECPDLDISAVGVGMAELRSCLHSDIRMAWKRIVRAPDDNLSPPDQKIKARFRHVAEELQDA